MYSLRVSAAFVAQRSEISGHSDEREKKSEISRGREGSVVRVRIRIREGGGSGYIRERTGVIEEEKNRR